MIKIEIQGYGMLRELGEGLIVELQEGCSISQIKDILISRIGKEKEALIHDSVFANDIEILPHDFIVTQDSRMYILPPVCGG